ncbi:MAG: hypothetical protein FWD61_03705 [Phycisphaerales bacterium]|nr:hypothetical protein [Phycisphaerales bacterium]
MTSETSPSGPTESDVKPDRVGNYIVCFLDLLGQKEKLEDWAELLPDGKPSPTFIQGMNKTVYTIQNFYEWFRIYFDALKNKTVFNQQTVTSMGTKEQECYQRQMDFQLGVERFSDSFVFYAPLGNARGELMALPIYLILGACCIVMSQALAGEVPLRGGIHIAPGVKISKLPEPNFYGPALAGAYRLESEDAQYPRIVVSQKVWNFTRYTPPESTGCPWVDQGRLNVLRACQNLLCEDGWSDRKHIVDWLGSGSQQRFGSLVKPEILRKCHDFVAKELEQCKGVKLAGRYRILYQYILDSLSNWGMQFTQDNTNTESLGDGE